MKKRGFTLVELIAVIGILGIISLIVIPVVSNTIRKSRTDLYDVQINNISDAAKLWASDNMALLPTENDDFFVISLGELKNNGLIESDFKNPKTKEEFNDDKTCVVISKNDLGFDYNVSFDEECDVKKTYIVNLDKGGSTNNPTSSIVVTKDSNEISPREIVVPIQEYSVSGFGLSSLRKSDGSSVSNGGIKTSSYKFSGWFSESPSGNLVLSNTTTPILIDKVTGYTGENGIWIKETPTTLYARFSGAGSVVLPTIEKTGYKCGWTANEYGTKVQHGSGATISGLISDVVLYGVCEANKYTLTIDPNGGSYNGSTSSFTSSSKFTYGTDDLNSIGVASRTGYTLTGYYDSNGVKVYDSNGKAVLNNSYWNSVGQYIYTGNLTVKAQWSINSYTITYNYSENGGTSSTKSTDVKNYMESIDLSVSASKPGWTFVGWNTNKDATSGLSSLSMGLNNVTLYAIYKKEAITLTASWNSNGATLSSSENSSCTLGAVYNKQAQNTSCDVTAPTITAPSNTPTIIGFNTSAGSNSNNSSYNTSTGKLTLNSSNNGSTWYAQTKKDAVTYTITFDKNGASTQTNSSGTSVSTSTVTRTCTIGATYNGAAQASSCSVTSPSFVAQNGMIGIGYSKNNNSISSDWNQNVSKNISSNERWYAISLQGIAKPSSSLCVARTYNGTPQQMTSKTSDTGYTLSEYSATDAGSYTVTATLNSGYLWSDGSSSNVTFDCSISKKTLTVTAEAKSKSYGDLNPSLTYKYSGNVSGQTPGFSGALTTTAETTSDVGTYDIKQGTLALTNGTNFKVSNYTLSYTKASLTINAKSVAVSWGTVSWTYDGNAHSTTASATGITGETINLKLTGNSITNVGSTNVTASCDSVSGGNAKCNNYSLTNTSKSISIGVRTLTVTATAKSKTYGESNPSLTYTYSGQVSGQTPGFSGALTTSAGTTSNVGTYDINQGTLALTNGTNFTASNYTLSYTKASLTINTKSVAVSWGTVSWTYDGSAHSTTASATGISGETIKLSLSGNSITNVGSTTVTASCDSVSGGNAKCSNYLLTSTTKSISIGVRTITVTAEAKTKSYGDSNPSLTYKYSGNVNGQTPGFSGSLTTSAGTNSNVGSYDITQGTLALANGTNFTASNYTLSYTKASLTISAKSVSVSWGTASWTYDGGAHSTTASATSGISGETINVSLTGNSITNKGSTTVTASCSSVSGGNAKCGNYSLTNTSKSISIGARTLTVIAEAKSKIYGNANPSLTYTYSGQVSGQTPGFSGALTTSAGIDSNVGSYDITQGTLALVNGTNFTASNYTLSYTKASLTITARSIAVQWNTLSWTYDGQSHSGEAIATAGVGAEVLKFTTTGSSLTNVGSTTVTAKCSSVVNGQAKCSNYKLTDDTKTIKVNAKKISVSWSEISWEYNGQSHRPSVSVTTGISGETMNLFLTTGSITDVSEKTYTASCETVNNQSTKCGNYSLLDNIKTAKVFAKDLTVEATSYEKFYNTNNPSLTYTYSGQVSGQTPKFTGSLTTTATKTSNVGSYNITQGTLALTNNGTFKAINYEIHFINGKLVVKQAFWHIDYDFSKTNGIKAGEQVTYNFTTEVSAKCRFEYSTTYITVATIGGNSSTNGIAQESTAKTGQRSGYMIFKAKPPTGSTWDTGTLVRIYCVPSSSNYMNVFQGYYLKG